MQKLAVVEERKASIISGGGDTTGPLAYWVGQSRLVEEEYAESRATLEKERWAASARSYRELRKFYELQQDLKRLARTGIVQHDGTDI